MKRHVVYATDARGADFLRISLRSLLEHADPSFALNVHVLWAGDGFDPSLQDAVRAVAVPFPFAKVLFHDVNSHFARQAELLRGKMVWARFFFAEFIDDEDANVLYIDTDTAIEGDLGELFDMDLGNDLVAAVSEVQYTGSGKAWKSAGFMPPGLWRYFNAGVVVFDLRKFREERFVEKAFAWYAAHRDEADCLDQDTLNAVTAGRVRYLHPRYNYNDGWLERQLKCPGSAEHWRGNRPRDVLEAILSPVICHFVGSNKPWKPGHRPERRRVHRLMRAVGMVPPSDPFRARLFDVWHWFLKRVIVPLRLRRFENRGK